MQNTATHRISGLKYITQFHNRKQFLVILKITMTIQYVSFVIHKLLNLQVIKV